MFVQSNTIDACLAYTKSRLQSQFSTSEIRLIQRAIFQKMFDFNATDLMTRGDYRLTESELLQVRAIVKRLQSNEPLQYVIGSTEFCDLNISCDKRALIPRPETEELVFKVLEQENLKYSPIKILDVCTGSGCIALALKRHFTNAHVYGLDYSTEALNLARENAEKLNLSVDFRFGDALNLENSNVIKENQWSLIISNPPYIPEQEKTLMAPNVLDFEPHMALFVEDKNPLVFYEKIATFALHNLAKNGLLAFELHENLAQKTADFCTNLGFSDVEIFEDLQGKQRMLLARV